uniref:Uncharacterized protein n=1 Tax=Romanomermis culicivorax TaxID=13658 RepID=A0A915HG50_ROMCU
MNRETMDAQCAYKVDHGVINHGFFSPLNKRIVHRVYFQTPEIHGEDYQANRVAEAFFNNSTSIIWTSPRETVDRNDCQSPLISTGLDPRMRSGVELSKHACWALKLVLIINNRMRVLEYIISGKKHGPSITHVLYGVCRKNMESRVINQQGHKILLYFGNADFLTTWPAQSHRVLRLAADGLGS